jgi:hypothetical protein
MGADEDEDARRRRAEELRRAIDEAADPSPPASPREFTDRAAREAAEEARERPAEDGDA